MSSVYLHPDVLNAATEYLLGVPVSTIIPGSEVFVNDGLSSPVLREKLSQIRRTIDETMLQIQIVTQGGLVAFRQRLKLTIT